MTHNAMEEVDTIIVERKPDFSQVCLWPGCLVGEKQIKAFEAFFKEQGFRVQYLEEVLTYPDLDAGFLPVPNTGGRNDVIFAIHSEDIPKFAVWRFTAGIRWIEDVLARHNHSCHMYDCDRLERYMTWDPTESAETIAAVIDSHLCGDPENSDD